MTLEAKICGLSTPETVECAVENGASYVGFMFFEPSPRYVTTQKATALANPAREQTAIVAVTVDADDLQLDNIVATLRPDYIQLHGAEPPSRIDQIRNRYKVKIIKALPIQEPSDVTAARAFRGADILLFEAKRQSAEDLPGGRGETFDWSLLDGYVDPKPWMLAGGLSAHTLKEAVRKTGARAVDVSSGVERTPGEKDPDLIRRFLREASSL